MMNKGGNNVVRSWNKGCGGGKKGIKFLGRRGRIGQFAPELEDPMDSRANECTEEGESEPAAGSEFVEDEAVTVSGAWSLGCGWRRWELCVGLCCGFGSREGYCW